MPEVPGREDPSGCERRNESWPFSAACRVVVGPRCGSPMATDSHEEECYFADEQR